MVGGKSTIYEKISEGHLAPFGSPVEPGTRVFGSNLALGCLNARDFSRFHKSKSCKQLMIDIQYL